MQEANVGRQLKKNYKKEDCLMNTEQQNYEATDKKIRSIHLIGGGLILIIVLLLMCPPLIGLWDRNDIWLCGLPLSQFMLFVLPLAAGIILMVIYFLEGRYIDETAEELEEGGQ